MTAATNPPDPPALRAADGLRDTLERALLGLRGLPKKFDRAPLRSALEDAMAALSAWRDSPLHAEDHLALLDRASTRTSDAVSLVRAIKTPNDASRRMTRSLDKAAATMRKHHEEIVDLLIKTPHRSYQGKLAGHADESSSPAPRAFRASLGLPSLHVLPERPKVRPALDVDAPEDDDADEDDTLNTPDTFVAGFGPALPSVDPLVYDEVAHVQRLARGCMEDIATFGNLRRRNEDERWVDVAPFEARLLANLDAFVSLGFVGPECARSADILNELLRWSDPGFLDKGRAFAAAFVLGCIEGDDTVRAALLSLSRAHPSTYGSYEDAFALAPSPAIRAGLERLLLGSDAALIELGLVVLRRRREASFGVVAPLLAHPVLEVARAAAKCLGVVAEQAPARLSIARLLGDEVDEYVAIAAAESALLLGAPEGLRHLRDRLSAEVATPGTCSRTFVCEALRLLSVAGGPGERAIVFDVMRIEEGGAVAVGWFGDPGHVGPLLDLLEVANGLSASMGYPSPFEVRVAEALHRITGAALRVAPSEVPTTEVTTDLVVNAALWRRWWDEHGGHFSAGRRYRFGSLYTPAMSVDEVAQETTRGDDRVRAALEIALTIDGGATLELSDWVARQAMTIEELMERAKSVRYTAGDWPSMRSGGGRMS